MWHGVSNGSLLRKMWAVEVFSIWGVLYQHICFFCLFICFQVRKSMLQNELLEMERRAWSLRLSPSASEGKRYWNLSGFICGKSKNCCSQQKKPLVGLWLLTMVSAYQQEQFLFNCLELKCNKAQKSWCYWGNDFIISHLWVFVVFVLFLSLFWVSLSVSILSLSHTNLIFFS